MRVWEHSLLLKLWEQSLLAMNDNAIHLKSEAPASRASLAPTSELLTYLFAVICLDV